MASTIKVNNIQNQCGANIINESANTITLGASGDNIVLAAGATQSGFGRTGTVDWDTTAKTGNFTAVSGNGYFVNTTSGAITMTLPATPSAGDIVAVKDYAGTFATNNLTIGRNGSNLDGSASDRVVYTNFQNFTMVYVDGTQGWIATNSGTDTISTIPAFVTATGGTITCCGDYKIHTFTSPGTFSVSCAGNPAGSSTVDYLVVAGGGGGGYDRGGGAGAGGYRESSGAASGCYTRSPLGACVSALPVTAQGYPITVGGGGTLGSPPTGKGGQGSNSVFSTITSTGGGGGGGGGPTPAQSVGGDGGSGGGAQNAGGGTAGGAGNTPPVNPPQGNAGGPAAAGSTTPGGGGGGGTVVGTTATAGVGNGVAGGAGGTTSISGSSVTYAGGGGGGASFCCGSTSRTGGAGGAGGGGPGGNSPGGGAGTTGGTNTGGGGGGGGNPGPSGPSLGAAGGSGIVVIRYKYQ